MCVMSLLLVFILSFFIISDTQEINRHIAPGKKIIYQLEEKVTEDVLSEKSSVDLTFQYLIIDLSSLNWIFDVVVELTEPDFENLNVRLKGHSLHAPASHHCVLVHDEENKGIYGCQRLSRFLTLNNENNGTVHLTSIDVHGYESFIELYVGCFGTLSKSYKTQVMESLYSCITTCKKEGYAYAGSKFNIECICMNDQLSMIPLRITQCRSSCNKRNGQICGGLDFAVYSTNVTLLGKNVILTKDCAFDESKCKVCDKGLIGISCVYRDCAIDEGGCLGYRCVPMNTLRSIARDSFDYVEHGLCSCRKGFRLLINGSCVDVDECSFNMCGDEAKKCENQIGSYSCVCKPGYTNDSAQICIDEDECSDDPCKNNTECANTEGSFECWCLSGFERKSQFECKDIDECKLGHHKCLEGKICHNTMGSYRCLCKGGVKTVRFNGTVICPDDNQCEGNHTCDLDASECIDLPINYFCRCLHGYDSVGTMQCQKILPNDTATTTTMTTTDEKVTEDDDEEDDEDILTFFGRSRIMKVVSFKEGASPFSYVFAALLVLVISVLSLVVSRRYILKIGQDGMPTSVMI